MRLKIHHFLGQLKPIIISFAALLWALFVIGWYFHSFLHPWDLKNVFHSDRFVPLGFTERLRILGSCFSAAATGFWSMGALWSCGRSLRKWLLLPAENVTLGFCLDLGFGFFFLNVFWMGLGLTCLWFESLWLVAALAFTGLMVKNLFRLPWGKIRFHFFQGNWLWVQWALAGIGLIYFGFLFLHGFLPETFYDSLNYFLGMPDFWLFQHGITDYPTHLLSGYFHGGGLFYLYAFVLGGTEGAKILSVFVLGFNTLFAFGWVKEKAGFTAGLVAAVAVVTFPLIYLNSWAVRVDGLSTFTTLLFFYCLEKACDGKASKTQGLWTGASALFAGLALTIKPITIVAILAGFLGVLWQRDMSFLKRKLPWIAFAGFGFFEIGPWLLKNAVFTGNPFFPYAVTWMGGRPIPVAGTARLLSENRQFLPMDHGFWSFLTLPWRLSMPGAGDGQWIGPLFLAFLPALFFLGMKNAATRFFTKVTLFSFVLGLTLSHMLRFSLPAFALSLLLFSAVFFGQEGKGWKALWTASVLACAVLFFGDYLNLSATYYDGSGIWRGLETREEYLDRKMQNSYEPLVLWTNENLPKDSRLLIVGDSRGVYYERPYLAQSAFDEPFFARAARSAKNAGEIQEQLRQLGVTHVVFNLPEGLRVSKEYHQYELRPEEWRRLDDFFERGLKPVYFRNFQGVYEVENQLRPAETREPLDPFSFLAPQAYDFFLDSKSENFKQAGKELDELTALFPRDPYWLSQKLDLTKAERVNMERGRP